MDSTTLERISERAKEISTEDIAAALSGGLPGWMLPEQDTPQPCSSGNQPDAILGMRAAFVKTVLMQQLTTKKGI
jgi:hypothetical protein